MDALAELGIALGKFAIYPDGHPLLATTVTRLARRLAPLLARHAALAIGVGHGQLVVEGAASDPAHVALRELATRLRKRQIGALRIAHGVSNDELAGLLHLLARESDDASDVLRAAGDRERWSHVRVVPLSYDRVVMADAWDDAAVAVDRAGAAAGSAAELWSALVRAAMAGASADPRATDAATVAAAIGRRFESDDGEREMLDVLHRLSERLAAPSDVDGDVTALRARVSSVLRRLAPETLRRAIAMGGDRARMRAFVCESARWLTADAVVELAHAAADVASQPLSAPMVQLLSKLALRAGATGHGRDAAAAALSESVQQLALGWALDESSSEDYRGALEQLTAEETELALRDAGTGEPLRTVMMALETETLGPRLRGAVGNAVRSGAMARLVELAQRAPSTAGAEWLWAHIGTEEHLRYLLTCTPVDLAVVDLLVDRLGCSAADALIDALEWLEDRTARRRVLDLLEQLGAEVGDRIIARMDGAPWYLLRNLLLLAGKLPSWPPGFSPAVHASHEDARVRREAYKLLLSDPSARADAIRTGLADDDEQVLRLVLTAGLHGLPEDAAYALMGRVERHELTGDLPPLAIRALGAAGRPPVVAWLVSRSLLRRGWLRRARLAPKTPELLATIAVLRQWPDHAGAAAVVARATRSKDPEIRAAASGAGAGSAAHPAVRP